MLRFESDYEEGAHSRILELLSATNLDQTSGYGEDHYCDEARALIRKACSAPEADVHFLVGGTQTNFIVIEAALRPWQGVLCAENGHINVHETGAVEATGHKVLALPAREGKISAEQIREACAVHYADASFEHMVQPGMVYLSSPTEFGTLYTKDELTDISRTCRELGLPLFVDGARMGYGLMSEANDVTLADYAALCDAFSIGGTKVGALFGEAVVIAAPSLKKDFRYLMKQRGAMLAKGRLLGLQFLALFQDDHVGDGHHPVLSCQLRCLVHVHLSYHSPSCIGLSQTVNHRAHGLTGTAPVRVKVHEGHIRCKDFLFKLFCRKHSSHFVSSFLQSACKLGCLSLKTFPHTPSLRCPRRGLRPRGDPWSL